MKMLIEVSGWIAAIMSIFISIPQIYKTFKLKEAEGMSKFSFSTFVIGMYLWCLYMIFAHSIQGSFVSLCFIGGFSIILFGIFKYSNNRYYIFIGISLLIAFIAIACLSIWVLSKKITIDKNAIFIIGIISGFITNVVFIPQTIETFRTREVEDISGWTFFISALSYIFWMFYWIALTIIATDLKAQLPGLIFTAIWLINMIIQTTLIFYYQNQNKRLIKMNQI